MAYVNPLDADPSVSGSVQHPVSIPVEPAIWTKTVISQYANSPVLLSIIESFSDAVNPSALIDSFYNDVWNIDTAQGYGLDVWGRIVGVSRALSVIGGQSGITFGFAEAGSSAAGFGQSTFYPGSQATSIPNYVLSDAIFRNLILIKALANITPRSITAMNNSLMMMFAGRGNAYVVDRGNMRATLTFSFLLSPVELAILTQSGAFPAPSGVLIDIAAYEIPYVFGFAEAGSSANSFSYGAFIQGTS